jgi:hypothetical protein
MTEKREAFIAHRVFIHLFPCKNLRAVNAFFKTLVDSDHDACSLNDGISVFSLGEA